MYDLQIFSAILWVVFTFLRYKDILFLQSIKHFNLDENIWLYIYVYMHTRVHICVYLYLDMSFIAFSYGIIWKKPLPKLWKLLLHFFLKGLYKSLRMKFCVQYDIRVQLNSSVYVYPVLWRLCIEKTILSPIDLSWYPCRKSIEYIGKGLFLDSVLIYLSSLSVPQYLNFCFVVDFKIEKCIFQLSSNFLGLLLPFWVPCTFIGVWGLTASRQAANFLVEIMLDP